jgi:hypothetical protein
MMESVWGKAEASQSSSSATTPERDSASNECEQPEADSIITPYDLFMGAIYDQQRKYRGRLSTFDPPKTLAEVNSYELPNVIRQVFFGESSIRLFIRSEVTYAIS